MCRSPFLGLIIWLKPRGRDRLMEIVIPPPVWQFNDFVFDNMSTGQLMYTKDELRAESILLIIAGFNTTTASLVSLFWYLVRAPRGYQKLVDELQRTFPAAEDVVYGPKLLGCTYLRECIDEGMRLVPPGPCEPPREVVAGGLKVLDDYYHKGTVVGTAPWCDSLNVEVYGDPTVFRPERWVAAGVTKEMVTEIRTNFHPFLTDPGSCAGKGIALAELLLFVARTLLR
ncbi:putative cytochrome 67 [Diaporthe sp. PMI_573]|nr:putative cytochrome 67 [Diaporthaceae sp. PMI_573]